MKTFIKIAILIICLGLILGLALCLTACNKEPVTNIGNDNTDSGNKGQWTEYDGLSFGYVNAKDCEKGNIQEDKIKSDIQFELGNTYYMVIDFAIQAERDNSGTDRLHTNLQIMPAEVVDATIQDAATGEVKEEVLDKKINISLSYKIPELAETVKQTRLVIQIRPINKRNSDIAIKLLFESENNLNAVKTTTAEDVIVGDYTQGLDYTETSDGGYSVSKGTAENEQQVVIPLFKNDRYVTSIDDNAFKDCSSLTSITLPDNLTSIGDHAFHNCTLLTGITLPKTITSIGGNAFTNCDLITSVIIPNSVTTIGDYAFAGCSSLTNVTMPDSVSTIGGSAFEGCSLLVGVYISDVAAWCNINFSDSSSNPLSYAKNLYLNNQLVVDLVIPNMVTSICDYAFYNCSSLNSVTILNGITSIKKDVFNGCIGLTNISMADSVSSIGDNAFKDCNVQNLTCPSTAISFIPKDNLQTAVITSGNAIEDGAFNGCRKLTSIIIPDCVTSISSTAFNNCISLTNITCPTVAISYVPKKKSANGNFNFRQNNRRLCI